MDLLGFGVASLVLHAGFALVFLIALFRFDMILHHLAFHVDGLAVFQGHGIAILGGHGAVGLHHGAVFQSHVFFHGHDIAIFLDHHFAVLHHDVILLGHLVIAAEAGADDGEAEAGGDEQFKQCFHIGNFGLWFSYLPLPGEYPTERVGGYSPGSDWLAVSE